MSDADSQQVQRRTMVEYRGSGVLTVARHDGSGAVTITVQGEIDLATAGQLRDAIIAAVTDAEPDISLVVDLAELRFIDSAGISALLRGRRSALAAGRTFRVDGAAGLVLEVLQLTGVWSLLSGEAV
ncbi:STAS domain-containing protein [Dactylosporangium sp. NPDC051484]|uniref:STAS domain-containing protein n=1 Tax=Dactylosporangium sp. NPDC051484 TaxID=3154942 RepID=UPI00344D1ACB